MSFHNDMPDTVTITDQLLETSESISLSAILTSFEDRSGEDVDELDELNDSWVMELLKKCMMKVWFDGKTTKQMFQENNNSDKTATNFKIKSSNTQQIQRVVVFKSMQVYIKRILEVLMEESFGILEESDEVINESQSLSEPNAHDNSDDKKKEIVAKIRSLYKKKRLAQVQQASNNSYNINSLFLSTFLTVFEQYILFPCCSVHGYLNKLLQKLIKLEKCRGSWEETQSQKQIFCDTLTASDQKPKLDSIESSTEAAEPSNTDEPNSKSNAKRRKIDSLSVETLESKLNEDSEKRLRSLIEVCSGIREYMSKYVNNIGCAESESLSDSNESNFKLDIITSILDGDSDSKKVHQYRTISAIDLYQSESHYYALLGNFDESIKSLEAALRIIGNSNDSKKELLVRQLIVRLLQRPDTDTTSHTKARELLKINRFEATISKRIFQFKQQKIDLSSKSGGKNSDNVKYKSKDIKKLRSQIVILDNVFPNKSGQNSDSVSQLQEVSDLDFLRTQVFTDSFFKHHGYDSLLYDSLLTRSNPDYFSLFHDLEKPRNKLDLILKRFVERIKRFCGKPNESDSESQYPGTLPDLSKARFAETWTHRRTHLGSHQLHVDSKNEGRTKHIENPVATFVLFLETVDKDSDSDDIIDESVSDVKDTTNKISGPTLITNQVRGTEATTIDSTIGFYAFPKVNRAVCFPGDLYHGVLPGKIHDNTVLESRRHTLMISLWEELEETKIQHHLSPMKNCPVNGNRIYGPCRSVCLEGSERNEWMKKVLFDNNSEEESESEEDFNEDDSQSSLQYAHPVFAGHLWEAADGTGRCKPGKYSVEKCFQF